MSAEKVFSADISIHAPTRGATRFYATYFLVIRDFNPRSHEGSDAEAKRATDTEVISIHAPTRGATVPNNIQHISVGNFNPRSHEGSDK